jgi:hypothetical protein
MVHFCQPDMTQQPGDFGLTLNIWQCMIKERKKVLFTQLLWRYPGSEQYASELVLVKFNKGGCFL